MCNNFEKGLCNKCIWVAHDYELYCEQYQEYCDKIYDCDDYVDNADLESEV